jgi:hypothetical protein
MDLAWNRHRSSGRSGVRYPDSGLAGVRGADTNNRSRRIPPLCSSPLDEPYTECDLRRGDDLTGQAQRDWNGDIDRIFWGRVVLSAASLACVLRVGQRACGKGDSSDQPNPHDRHCGGISGHRMEPNVPATRRAAPTLAKLSRVPAPSG